jgi:hypothetical protein
MHVIRYTDHTAQEVKFISGSEYKHDAILARPWTPMSVALGEEVTLNELNAARADVRFFFSTTARVYSRNKTTLMSLEQLNDVFETVQDPQSYIKDEETGEYVHSLEATENVYREFRRVEKEQRINEPGLPEGYYSIFERESVPVGEAERPAIRERA